MSAPVIQRIKLSMVLKTREQEEPFECMMIILDRNLRRVICVGTISPCFTRLPSRDEACFLSVCKWAACRDRGGAQG